ncbi:hypothetical protein EJD97_011130, partial [Solanum chilense]
INTRRNAGRRVGEAADGGNKAPLQAPVVVVQVPVKPSYVNGWRSERSTGSDGPSHHYSGTTITAQATRESALRENPHASTVASRLRDFTRMNPPVYFGSRAS